MRQATTAFDVTEPPRSFDVLYKFKAMNHDFDFDAVESNYYIMRNMLLCKITKSQSTWEAPGDYK